MKNPGEKKISDIQNYAYHVAEVSCEAPEPSFAYSIGLYHSFKHPEIIIFGLGFDTMYYIIRTLADEIKLGAAFEAGKSYSNVIENYDVVFRTVAGKWYSDYLGQAIWFYQNPEFPVIQCFWPDKNN